MVPFRTVRRILQGTIVAGGLYLLVPDSFLRDIMNYPIVGFITPGFLVGAALIIYGIMALRDKI
jgi:hypothetical protein